MMRNNAKTPSPDGDDPTDHMRQIMKIEIKTNRLLQQKKDTVSITKFLRNGGSSSPSTNNPSTTDPYTTDPYTTNPSTAFPSTADPSIVSDPNLQTGGTFLSKI